MQFFIPCIGILYYEYEKNTIMRKRGEKGEQQTFHCSTGWSGK
jgi:hypothetical protein